MSDGELIPAVCIFCGVGTAFSDDPSPDLCRVCQRAGRRSPLWTEEHQARWEEGLRRIERAREAFNERYRLTS